MLVGWLEFNVPFQHKYAGCMSKTDKLFNTGDWINTFDAE